MVWWAADVACNYCLVIINYVMFPLHVIYTVVVIMISMYTLI